MTYMITIKGVQLESTSLMELVEFAIEEGACPSTKIYANGRRMFERVEDFICL